jgi:zinc transporter ZupT
MNIERPITAEARAPAPPLPPPSRVPAVVSVAAALLLFALAALWLATSGILNAFNNGAPPVETLTFERKVLDPGVIRLLVRAGGSEPLTIAQVQVDAAYWSFTQEPGGEIPRGGTAWLNITYPWVLGEALAITVLTKFGTAFETEIPVAVPTPSVSVGQLWPQALLGAFVGILPIAIGLMFYPALRNVGRGGLDFLLALTIGLLAFLLVDMTGEALELSGEAAPLFQGPVMVALAAAASFLLLLAAARWRGTPSGIALAGFIALGIGLHNFGEGLAIGAAFAAGAAGLGTFLVLGFALHNVTEGIGIAAPMLRAKPTLLTFVWLTLLGGVPAMLGLWLGSLAFSPQWAALFLAIGAGAILQVIVEVGAYLTRIGGRGPSVLLSPLVIGGLAAGALFMYVTAALVKI